MSAPAGPQGSRALRLHRELAANCATGPGLQRLASVNHSVIGLRIMVTAFVFFVIAGLLGMLTRVQLATPASAFMDPETYNQVFTLHGSVMLFLFVIPMLEGIAVYLTPKILGARDFAFPRLTAFSYWLIGIRSPSSGSSEATVVYTTRSPRARKKSRSRRSDGSSTRNSVFMISSLTVQVSGGHRRPKRSTCGEPRTLITKRSTRPSPFDMATLRLSVIHGITLNRSRGKLPTIAGLARQCCQQYEPSITAVLLAA